MNGTPDEATLTAWIWRGLLGAGGWRPAWRLQLEVKTLGVFVLVFGVEVLVGLNLNGDWQSLGMATDSHC